MAEEKKAKKKDLHEAIKGKTNELQARTKHWQGQRVVLSNEQKESMLGSASDLGNAKKEAAKYRDALRVKTKENFNAAKHVLEIERSDAIAKLNRDFDESLKMAHAIREAVYQDGCEEYKKAIEPACKRHKDNVKQYEANYRVDLRDINNAELKNLDEIRKLIAEFTEALTTAEDEEEKAA